MRWHDFLSSSSVVSFVCSCLRLEIWSLKFIWRWRSQTAAWPSKWVLDDQYSASLSPKFSIFICDLWPRQVSPTMCAEELTNQVLYMRNTPPGDREVWMTFEAIEDGQLGEIPGTWKTGSGLGPRLWPRNPTGDFGHWLWSKNPYVVSDTHVLVQASDPDHRPVV